MRQAGTWWQPSRSSGNRAFDEYRQDTLRRLEEEQREFQDFLARLRMAKDKAEFDQFMAERRTPHRRRRTQARRRKADAKLSVARLLGPSTSGGRPDLHAGLRTALRSLHARRLANYRPRQSSRAGSRRAGRAEKLAAFSARHSPVR